MAMAIGIAAIAIAAIVIAPPAAGQGAAGEETAARLPDPRGLGDAERRQELKRLKARISELSARYQATRKKEADTKAALEAASLNLEIKTVERRMLEITQTEVEKAAGNALSVRNGAKERTDRLRGILSERLRALNRMGRSGYLRTLTAVDSGRSFLRGLQLLSYMTKRDSELLRQYERSLFELAGREEELRKKREELFRVVLEARQKEQELILARSEKITLLSRLQKTSAEEKSTLEKLEDKASRLEALLLLLESRGRALPPGAADIRRFKGVLDWPIRGKVLLPFGRVANPHFPGTFLRSSGWTLEAPRGKNVKVIFAGDAVYSQWLKGYGNMVVVDHGDGVFSLYGRLMPQTVARGTRLAVGDTVGQVGDPPEGELAGLYFEIREARQSVDPRLWLR